MAAADSSSEPSSGLKKGAWTEEEDNLLRKCIHKYGEGKWHLVPVRAGLNRCRKSCRLRWLNYLRPNIKRGDFNSDEVDLILRLHKLLGNRWSLIAGRLPGRTANDVKNFWNTRLQKKKFVRLSSEGQKWNNVESPKTTENTVIIRPRPRRFSRTEKTFAIANDVQFQGYTSPPPPPPQTAEAAEITPEGLTGNAVPPHEEISDDDLTHWLEDFLFDDGMMTCMQQGQTQECDFHMDSDLLELLS